MNVPINLDRAGVHSAHCCKKHGCKYADMYCPVRNGSVVQMYRCEMCDYEDDKVREAVELLQERGYTVTAPWA